MENDNVEVGNITYHGPHKWIIGILGSDTYSAKRFMLANKEAIRKSKNLNISIMALSSNPLTNHHVKDYKELTEMTHQGIYLNIVNKSLAYRLSSRFFSKMDVYPSGKLPIIREYFQNS